MILSREDEIEGFHESAVGMNKGNGGAGWRGKCGNAYALKHPLIPVSTHSHRHLP